MRSWSSIKTCYWQKFARGELSLLLVTCIGLLGRRWGSSKPGMLLLKICNPLCSLMLQCCTFPCSLSVLHWVSGFRDASLFLLYCVGGPGFTVTAFECHCGCCCLPSTALDLMNFNCCSCFAEHLETSILKYISVLIWESASWTNFPILYSYFSYLF